MTGSDARDTVRASVSSAAFAKLERFCGAVLAANARQNLIAVSTAASIWHRHVLDSLQLLRFGDAEGVWLDIGTGGGFPGMVIAIATEGQRPIRLVEPRRRRAEFLAEITVELGLSAWTQIDALNVEQLALRGASIISARAVATAEKLLRAAEHCATTRTRWLLPRGRMQPDEIDALQREWRGTFHVEQSITDPASSIIVATGVASR